MENEFRSCSGYAAGVKLHWMTLGEDTSAPPVVMLHGLNDCHLTWTLVALELAKDRRILIPDLPGHGLSERPDASYQLQWHAQVMAAWLESLELEQVDLVGHSFGGGVAQMLMRECRERIRRVALLSSGGLGREVALQLRLASLPWVMENLGQPFMAPITRITLWNLRRSLPNAHIEKVSAMNAQKGTARAFARTVSDVINLRGQYRSLFHHVHEVPELPPLALFWGNRDRIIPVTHAHAVAEAIHDVHLTVFEGCGHYPHHERPQAVAEGFRGFFDAPVLLSPRLINTANNHTASLMGKARMGKARS